MSWNEIKCFLGIHQWKYDRPLNWEDGCPTHYVQFTPPMRVCKVCGKRQRWIPGYGGNSWGCWIEVNYP